MSWHAEYVAAVADDEKSLGLTSWVSIDNQSGATYPDAKLDLIAGDVHRVEEPGPRPMFEMAKMAAGAPRLEEKAFFEYHMYTLAGDQHHKGEGSQADTASPRNRSSRDRPLQF